MTFSISKNKTIIDYLNIYPDYIKAVGESSSNIIGLDRCEWIQFINLVTMDYQGSKAVTTLEESGTCGKYKDLVVYLTGTEGDRSDYLYAIDHMHNAMAQIRQANQQTARGAPTPTPLIRSYPEPPRSSSTRDGLNAWANAPTVPRAHMWIAGSPALQSGVGQDAVSAAPEDF